MNDKKLKTPCSECPFRRSISPGETGGSHPLVYVGQSTGPFFLPCHSDDNYSGKETRLGDVQQCAGAAIYRANIGVSDLMPDALHKLPPDKGIVFASHAEFVSHHCEVTTEEAELSLRILTPEAIMEAEMRKLRPDQIQKVS